jgi:hypothetical protein
MATQTPTEDVGEGRVLLVLVGEDEAARIGQPLDAAHRLDAAEGGQHHRIGEGQSCGPTLPSSAISSTMHLAGLEPVHPRIGDPLDVLVAHLAFEQALGVADPVEAEMADIGLGGDEGHRHLVAHLRVAQRLSRMKANS